MNLLSSYPVLLVDDDSPLLRSFAASEGLARQFSGLETETHWIEIGPDGAFAAPCLAVASVGT